MTVNSIYLIRNEINKKVYVGQTWQILNKRYSKHKYKSSSKHLRNAFNKYGKENFSITLLAECYLQETADFLETAFVEIYNSTNREVGYNIQGGGTKGKSRCTIENIVNLSRSHLKEEIQEDWLIIRKLDPELIAQIKDSPNNDWSLNYNIPQSTIDIIINNDIRYCNGCRCNKHISEYNETGNKKCKDCIQLIQYYQTSNKNKLRRKKYYQRHKEEIKQKSQKYRDEPKNKEHLQKYFREYKKRKKVICET